MKPNNKILLLILIMIIFLVGCSNQDRVSNNKPIIEKIEVTNIFSANTGRTIELTVTSSDKDNDNLTDNVSSVNCSVERGSVEKNDNVIDYTAPSSPGLDNLNIELTYLSKYTRTLNLPLSIYKEIILVIKIILRL